MNNLTLYVRWDQLPDCCKDCRFRDCVAVDEYQPYYHYCMRGVAIPVIKKSCKVKQKHQICEVSND